MLNKALAVIIAFVLLITPIRALAYSPSAYAAAVMDVDTHTLLHDKNAHTPLPMASTTKIMTAIIAIENADLEQSVLISDAMLCEGSSLGLKAGDIVSLNDLIIGMLLCSGNDAANAVAITVASSIESFVLLMNNKAKAIGMSDTLFVTPSGLDEGEHHSTAFDMALLASYAVNNELFCEIVSKKSAKIIVDNVEQTVYNHNKLLGFDDSFFGVKTGFTSKAGRCLVSAKSYGSARLVCVTLNAPNDWQDHMSLLDECEKLYSDYSSEIRLTINAVGGEYDTLNCSYSYSLYLLNEPSIKLYYHRILYAPIHRGDVVGYAYLYSNNILIERLPIEADEDLNYAKQE